MLGSAIIVRPFSAKVLDIVGKKRTLVLSVGLFALTTFFYLTINAFIPLLILRFIHGISFSIVTTATSSIAADIVPNARKGAGMGYFRSEEHTSELQSRGHLVCSLLLEQKKS